MVHLVFPILLLCHCYDMCQYIANRSRHKLLKHKFHHAAEIMAPNFIDAKLVFQRTLVCELNQLSWRLVPRVEIKS
ncbi:hypothetical protein EDC96DRAFT_492947 [Choanephora cucurbitarum]|nr:hypothetical protein EDC96DRAFT_492947 [Choanephora cucurbitarum]